MPTNTSETGRNEWSEAPDTKGRRSALLLLIAISLIVSGLLVCGSLTALTELHAIARVHTA
jgi:hypothetical protein